MWMAVALSQLTPTHKSPIPRMVKLDEVKLLLVNETLGRVSCRSLAFSICCASSASAENALTAIGTSCRLCAWRCAVTTISGATLGPLELSCAYAGNASVAPATPIIRVALTLIRPLLIGAVFLRLLREGRLMQGEAIWQ